MKVEKFVFGVGAKSPVTWAKMSKPTSILTTLTKKRKLKTFQLFFNRRCKIFHIFREFQQLSTSLCWRGVMAQVCEKQVAHEVQPLKDRKTTIVALTSSSHDLPTDRARELFKLSTNSESLEIQILKKLKSFGCWVFSEWRHNGHGFEHFWLRLQAPTPRGNLIFLFFQKYKTKIRMFRLLDWSYSSCG